MRRKTALILLAFTFLAICVLSIYLWVDKLRKESTISVFDPATLILLISIIATIVTIITLYANFFQRERHHKIYISYTPEAKSEADRIMWKFKGQMFSSQFSIGAGDSIKDNIHKQIKYASFCIVLVGEELSKMQLYEIRVMKQLNKRIIPVLLSDNTVIPQILSDIQFISFDRFIKS